MERKSKSNLEKDSPQVYSGVSTVYDLRVPESVYAGIPTVYSKRLDSKVEKETPKEQPAPVAETPGVPALITEDRVPTEIDIQRTAVLTGHRSEYIQEKVKKYGLTTLDLHAIEGLRKDYKVKVPTVLGLIEKGHSLEEVEAMLETRAAFGDIIRITGNQGAPSLKNLSALMRRFPELRDNLSSEDLAERVKEISGIMRCKYIDAGLIHFLDVTNRHPKIVYLDSFTALTRKGDEDLAYIHFNDGEDFREFLDEEDPAI